MEHPSEQKRVFNDLVYYSSTAGRAVINFPNSGSPEDSPTPANDDPASMGSLAPLPLEVLHNILRELDIESLGAMRCVNKQSKDIVAMLPAYRDVAIYARVTLRALSATGLLSRYSVKYLHSELRQHQCNGYDKFGPFIFLPRW